MRRTLTILGFAVLLLVALGFIVLTSASCAYSANNYHGDIYALACRQAMWLPLALIAFACAWGFDYRLAQKHPMILYVAYGLVVAMLITLLPCVAPHLGFKATKGAFRWLSFGSIRIQPSELAKIVVILLSTYLLSKLDVKNQQFFKGSCVFAAVVGVPIALFVTEPDFGSVFVLGSTALGIFLISGVKFLHLAILGAVGLACVIPVLATNMNRMRRIVAWLPDSLAADFARLLNLPEEVTGKGASSAGDQLNAALVAIKRGGITGVGLNESMQKEKYLPEGHTDFIFAVGAEELGVVFSVALLVLFLIVFICGIIISLHAPDRFGKILAYGCAFLLFFQVDFNVGVVTGALPTKGLALPFFSYGGTNLIAAFTAVGLLFNVGWRSKNLNSCVKSTLSSIYTNKE